jgi:hypothetical protein
VLQLFRNNQIVLSILLFPYLSLLLISGYTGGPQLRSYEQTGVLGGWLYRQAAALPTWGYLAALLTALFVAGVIVNAAFFEHRLTHRQNLFAGLFVGVMSLALPQFIGLPTLHAANLFLLVSLTQILQVYGARGQAVAIFNAGFWLGVATLFVPNYLWFLLPVLMSLSYLRATRTREILMVLIGLILPWFFAAVYWFWHDDLSYFLDRQFLAAFAWFRPGRLALPGYSQLGYYAVLIGLALSAHGGIRRKLGVAGRKKLSILYWFLVFAGLSLLSSGTQPGNHYLLVLAVPLGITLSLYFSRLGPSAGEAAHLLLLVVTLLFHFLPWIGAAFVR